MTPKQETMRILASTARIRAVREEMESERRKLDACSLCGEWRLLGSIGKCIDCATCCDECQADLSLRPHYESCSQSDENVAAREAAKMSDRDDHAFNRGWDGHKYGGLMLRFSREERYGKVNRVSQ